MAGYRKDAIVQLLLFHIAVYPIMLIYFNPGISLILIGILEFIFSYFFEYLLSYTIWISVIHPGGHGLAKRLSGATEWESLLNGFSVLSHFIVTVLWTLLRNLYKMVPVILQHFLTSLLNGFTQKTTFDIIWLTYHFYLSTKCGSWV